MMFDIESAGKPSQVLALGAAGAGKTTLLAAILKFLAREGRATPKTYEQLHIDRIERDRSLPFRCAQADYETGARAYRHFDCPGRSDYLDYTLRGSGGVEACLLVVDPQDTSAEVGRQVELARFLGVRKWIIFLNKCDLTSDPERLHQAEAWAYRMLGAAVTGVLCIRGSAMQALQDGPNGHAGISELLRGMNEQVPAPPAQRPPLPRAEAPAMPPVVTCADPAAVRPAPPEKPEKGEEEELWQSLAAFDSAYGPGSAKALRVCNLLADYYRTNHQPERAIALLRHLLTSPNEEFRDWKGNRQNLLINLAHLLRQLKRDDEALPWLKEAAENASIYETALLPKGMSSEHAKVIAEFKEVLNASRLSPQEREQALASYNVFAQNFYARIGRKEPGDAADKLHVAQFLAAKIKERKAQPAGQTAAQSGGARAYAAYTAYQPAPQPLPERGFRRFFRWWPFYRKP